MKSSLFLRTSWATLALLAAPAASALSMLPWEGVRSFQEVVTHDGEIRYVSYLRPANPAPGMPALFLLPYNGGTAPAMANLTEAGQLVRDFGIWVIVPVAVSGEWAHNPVRPGMPDDVGFLAAAIDHAVSAYGIDPRRVYMAGYSAGGNMSMRFACEHPEKLAGAGNVAATLREELAERCQPALPVPVVFMHGTADDQVPYEHGPYEYNDLLLRGALSAPEAARFWSGLNHCGATPQRSDRPDTVADGTTVYIDRYTGCDQGTTVELFTVVNGGHNWPGSLDFIPRIGLVNQDISGTRELWQFFQRFSRP